MKKIINASATKLLLIFAIALGSMFFVPVPVSAVSCESGMVPATNMPSQCVKSECKDVQAAQIEACQNGDGRDLNAVFKTIVNTALYIIGALGVLMLIYGGIRYTTSAGNSKAVEGAKSTIMYAIIGIIVALLAYAIVNFVLNIFNTPTV
jgi:hypothetical protein